jgi:hypothetical protein
MEIRKVRNKGASKIIAITGFAEIGEHYKIDKKGENKIILTKVE